MMAMAGPTQDVKQKPRGGRRWRPWVQAAFLLVWLDPTGLRIRSMCAPVFHCYACPLATLGCPIGVLAGFSALHIFPFIALGLVLAVGALVGTALCGWACPFGFLQDLAGRVPTPRFRLPGWTGYLRYAVLVGLVLAVPHFFGKDHPLYFCRLCPAGALEAALPGVVRAAWVGGETVWPNAAKIAVTAVVVAALFVTWRPWCRVLCPLGALYSLANRVSLLALRLDRAEFAACRQCRKACRAGIDPMVSPNDSRCVRCLDCTGHCSALEVGTVFGKRRR